MEDIYDINYTNYIISDELINKLKNGYSIQQIIFTLNKCILDNNIDIHVYISDTRTPLILYKSHYINNIIYYYVLPFNNYNDNYDYKDVFICNIINTNKYNIKNINIKLNKIEKIYKFSEDCLPIKYIKNNIDDDINNNKTYILSDSFDTLDDLKTYIINNSLLDLNDVEKWIKIQLKTDNIIVFKRILKNTLNILYEQKYDNSENYNNNDDNEDYNEDDEDNN